MEPDPPALSDWLGRAAGRRIATAAGALALDDLVEAGSLGDALGALAGASVVLMAGDPLKTAAALIDLDGRARRIVLCPPELEPRHLAAVIRDAEADALVHDGDAPPPAGTGLALLAPCRLAPTPRPAPARRLATEWVLLTSGTTGDPKMVVHTLATLTGAIAPEEADAPVKQWATFYDIRRYGGLQILLRALAGRGSLILRAGGESIDDFLGRAGRAGVTHISGTPTHWRLVLMSAAARRIDPAYVRLSGEIADAALLDALAALYPRARVAHAFASTEAGVAFEIGDGRPGFPASLLGAAGDGVALEIVEGALRIRSARTALRYLGAGAPALRDADGFVDTGDMIAVSDGRCRFVGRRGGIINVGGAKVNPEEVEATINLHPAVRASLVAGRRNPITGAVVAAEVVLAEGVAEYPELRSEILALCADRLAPFKAPALIRFVPALAVTAGGKLARHG